MPAKNQEAGAGITAGGVGIGPDHRSKGDEEAGESGGGQRRHSWPSLR